MSGDEPEGNNEYEKIEEYQIVDSPPAAEERWSLFTFVLWYRRVCVQRLTRTLLAIRVVTSYK
jgi:hypothetical protein